MALNQQSIKRAVLASQESKKRAELADSDHAGLRLRVTPNGKATWVLGCRDLEGRARRYPLGAWPTMGVSAARAAARAMRVKVDQGADPIFEAQRKRLAAKQARDGIGSLAAVIDLYGRTDHAQKMKSWPECDRRIKCVFEANLSRPIEALTRTALQFTADRWSSPQSAAAAVRYLRPILKWAADRGYAAEDLARIKPPATVGRRDRVLSREELAALLPVLRASDRPYAAAMRFLLMTLARREEACAARWGDVDTAASTWTIPVTKNGQPHIVPLSRQAVALLKSIRPARAHPTAYVFASRDGGPLQNWDRETKALMAASKTQGWTRHDLRRTGATMLGELGELPDIIEAALNHASIHSQLAATYNRSRYRPQVAAALQRLADALDAIEPGRPQSCI